MRRKLFNVEDCLYTVSRRLVLASEAENGSLDVEIGDSIILVTPDGTEIETEAEGVDNFENLHTPIHAIYIENLTKEQVPIGTEVFLTVSTHNPE